MDHNKEWDQEKNDRILSDECETVLSAFLFNIHSCIHTAAMVVIWRILDKIGPEKCGLIFFKTVLQRDRAG